MGEVERGRELAETQPTYSILLQTCSMLPYSNLGIVVCALLATGPLKVYLRDENHARGGWRVEPGVGQEQRLGIGLRVVNWR